MRSKGLKEKSGASGPWPRFCITRVQNFLFFGCQTMKTIVAVLVESPLYFTLSLQDRYGLVKRLMDRENNIDLSAMHHKLRAFLTVKPQGG